MVAAMLRRFFPFPLLATRRIEGTKKFHSSHDEWNSTINFYNLMYMMCI